MNQQLKGNLILLLTAMLWGSGFVAQKLGMDSMEPFAFNGIRQCLAGLVLLPLALRVARRTGCLSGENREETSAKRRTLWRASLLCGSLLALGTNAQQVGLTMIPAGRSGFITAIYIVFVPVFGIFLGKKLRIRVWLAVLLALAGFALLSLRGGLDNLGTGDLVTLLSAAFLALQILAVDRQLASNDAIILSTAQMLVSGVISVAAMLLFEHISWASLLQTALPLLYSALLPTAAGYTMQVVGQQYTSPAIASLLMSLESVFSVLFGMIFLGEHMEAREWMGCAAIFAATLLAQLPGSEPRESCD